MTTNVNAAQDKYPIKPIRFVVPFIPGAGTDITARGLSQKMSELAGQLVVVDNRPGASGVIGLELAAKSAPDGYTIVLVSATQSVNHNLHTHLPFDLLKDFTAVSQITSQPYCLTIHPGINAKTAKEFIELIRAKPNFYTYGSSGTGGLSHLAGSLMASMAKIQWIHVPYKGGAGGINDILGGQISSQFTTIIGTWQHVKAGRMRWLAVSTTKRAQAFPELPTLAEAALPGFDINGWYGILAPAATPKPIVKALHALIAQSLQTPALNTHLLNDGSEPVGSLPETFSAHIKKEVIKYAKLTHEAGMKID
jgi:hypothetical protein